MSKVIQDDRFNAIGALIQSQLVETGVPSLAVAVARKGEIIWEEGFGWANREDHIPATPHTLYSLASISKPITATGLMVLKERGLIDLERSINDYLGEAKLKAWIGSADDATVRRVANHSAGLPLHYQFFYEDEPYVRPSMDETIKRYGNLVTPPGEKYQYSNLGYGLLDYVISRLSGKSYTDFMREEVFIPLNMTRASVGIGPGLHKYQAVRYDSGGLPIPFYDFDHPGGSAVFSSAHDLVRFGIFHLKSHLPDQKAILSDASIDEMQAPTVEISKGIGYGIGWRIIENENGYRTVGHDGGMGGVNTRLILVPSESIAVAVLANAQTQLHTRIATETLSTLLPDYAKNKERRQAQKEQEKNQEEESIFRPTPALLGTWVGSVHTYKGDIPLTFEFHEDGDIHARLGDQLEILVNDARFEKGNLTGLMVGDIGTEDANRRPYHLHLNLSLRKKTLNGALTAISLPGQRMGNALSHWTELKRERRKRSRR